MGRWDPKSLDREPGRPDLPTRPVEDIDDVDDPAETLAHARQQAARIEAQLRGQPPTDPGLLERLQRDLTHWRHVAAAVTLGDHWTSGEGDRALF